MLLDLAMYIYSFCPCFEHTQKLISMIVYMDDELHFSKDELNHKKLINLIRRYSFVFENIKMKIRIALPENLKRYDKYEIVYISNGEIKETISAAVENGYIVFETNHLSQYGIIATNTGNGTKSPQTGDNSNLALWFAVLFISGGVLTVFSIASKKKRVGINK